MLSGEWSRSFQSIMPPLDSNPSRAAESDVVVLGKRELECPVSITNRVREDISGQTLISSDSEVRRWDPSLENCKTGRKMAEK